MSRWTRRDCSEVRETPSSSARVPAVLLGTREAWSCVQRLSGMNKRCRPLKCHN